MRRRQDTGQCAGASVTGGGSVAGEAARTSHRSATAFSKDTAPRHGVRPVAPAAGGQRRSTMFATGQCLPPEQLYKQAKQLRLVVDVVVCRRRPAGSGMRAKAAIVVTISPVFM